MFCAKRQTSSPATRFISIHKVHMEGNSLLLCQHPSSASRYGIPPEYLELYFFVSSITVGEIKLTSRFLAFFTKNDPVTRILFFIWNSFFDIEDMSPLQLCARKFGSKNNKFSLYTAVEDSL